MDPKIPKLTRNCHWELDFRVVLLLPSFLEVVAADAVVTAFLLAAVCTALVEVGFLIVVVVFAFDLATDEDFVPAENLAAAAVLVALAVADVPVAHWKKVVEFLVAKSVVGSLAAVPVVDPEPADVVVAGDLQDAADVAAAQVIPFALAGAAVPITAGALTPL